MSHEPYSKISQPIHMVNSEAALRLSSSRTLPHTNTSHSREADPIVHVSATCGTRRTFRWRTGASIDIRTYGAFSMSRKGCTCSATFCRHYITLGSTSRSSPITFRISCHLMQTVTCTPTNALPKFRIQQSTAAGKA